MNQGVLDKKQFEAIEAYVLGTMPATERVLFEKEISADAELRAEVGLQRENMLAIELGGVSRVLKELGNEQAREEHRHAGASAWRPYLKYAAAVALLVIGGIWWFSRPTIGERLFAEHFTADPGLPVAMGASNDPSFQDAMVAYKLGAYQEARDKWSPLLQADPTNDTLRFYIASASLAMEDVKTAIPMFEQLAGERASAFSARSQWYLFLAYVKAGDHARAKAIPLEMDATYGDRVRAIKAELRP